MRRHWPLPAVLLCVCVLLAADRHADAHGFGSAITWNREISRLIFERCASCHRPGSTAFSLMTYQDAQPRANQIKDAVLARRMPPWGAVKGFGHFRNDQSLTQEQIELVAKWVDGGIRRGNNPRMLPKPPVFDTVRPPAVPLSAIRIQGPFILPRAMVLEGLLPVLVDRGMSLRMTASLPGGGVVPLVWLLGYDEKYPHPFVFRDPLSLPAGTRIDGVPSSASIALLHAAR